MMLLLLLLIVLSENVSIRLLLSYCVIALILTACSEFRCRTRTVVAVVASVLIICVQQWHQPPATTKALKPCQFTDASKHNQQHGNSDTVATTINMFNTLLTVTIKYKSN